MPRSPRVPVFPEQFQTDVRTGAETLGELFAENRLGSYSHRYTQDHEPPAGAGDRKGQDKPITFASHRAANRAYNAVLTIERRVNQGGMVSVARKLYSVPDTARNRIL
jgi:hypothetical protein